MPGIWGNLKKEKCVNKCDRLQGHNWFQEYTEEYNDAKVICSLCLVNDFPPYALILSNCLLDTTRVVVDYLESDAKDTS